MGLLAPSYGQQGQPVTKPNLTLYSNDGSGGNGLLKAGDTPAPQGTANPFNDPSGFNNYINNLKSSQEGFLNANKLGPDNLLPGQRNFSDQTQKEISDYGDRAGHAAEDYVTNGMAGANEAQGLLDDAARERSRQATAMGGPQDPALNEALTRSSNNNFQNTLSKMKSSLNFQAPMYQAGKQAQYSNYLAQNEQNKNANFQQQVAYQNQQKQLFQQWQQAQDQASQGVLGAIMGGLGTVAGAVAGSVLPGIGTAAGAVAGGALGNATSKI